MLLRRLKKRQKNCVAQHSLQEALRLQKQFTEDQRFQRAFLHWIETTDDKSKQGIEIHVSDGMRIGFQLRIAGTSNCIYLTCRRNDLSVWAIKDEHTDACDLLVDWVVSPKRTKSGWINSCNLPEYQTPCNTLQALWRQEMFEALANWIKTRLHPAKYLCFSTYRDGGVFEGKLHQVLPEKLEDNQVIKPVWL